MLTDTVVVFKSYFKVQLLIFTFYYYIYYNQISGRIGRNHVTKLHIIFILYFLKLSAGKGF